MKLFDIEPNTHSPEDWNKRLNNSWIYGAIDNKPPATLYIRGIQAIQSTTKAAFDMASVQYKGVNDVGYSASTLSMLDVHNFKPDVGVYNLDYFPILLTHLPYRQWHFGATSESITCSRLSGAPISWNGHTLDLCFNPTYPTLGKAVELLKTRKKKHVALSKKVSLLASGVKLDRFLLLYNFLPIATIQNGMWFPASSGKPLERVANEYKDVLLSLI
jgi:hypothetical protein